MRLGEPHQQLVFVLEEPEDAVPRAGFPGRDGDRLVVRALGLREIGGRYHDLEAELARPGDSFEDVSRGARVEYKPPARSQRGSEAIEARRQRQLIIRETGERGADWKPEACVKDQVARPGGLPQIHQPGLVRRPVRQDDLHRRWRHRVGHLGTVGHARHRQGFPRRQGSGKLGDDPGSFAIEGELRGGRVACQLHIGRRNLDRFAARQEHAPVVERRRGE